MLARPSELVTSENHKEDHSPASSVFPASFPVCQTPNNCSHKSLLPVTWPTPKQKVLGTLLLDFVLFFFFCLSPLFIIVNLNLSFPFPSFSFFSCLLYPVFKFSFGYLVLDSTYFLTLYFFFFLLLCFWFLLFNYSCYFLLFTS